MKLAHIFEIVTKNLSSYNIDTMFTIYKAFINHFEIRVSACHICIEKLIIENIYLKYVQPLMNSKGPGFNSTSVHILRTSYEGVELSFRAFPMFIWDI